MRELVGIYTEEENLMDITVPCVFCKHFNRDERTRMTCAAFPNGIPKDIQEMKIIHTEQYHDDNEIRYEPINDIQDYFNYFNGELRI